MGADDAVSPSHTSQPHVVRGGINNLARSLDSNPPLCEEPTAVKTFTVERFPCSFGNHGVGHSGRQVY
jgi:hypothetical protein